jgi:hypothetical protein
MRNLTLLLCSREHFHATLHRNYATVWKETIKYHKHLDTHDGRCTLLLDVIMQNMYCP